ncbi:abscisic-aldehyde oxidase [Eucalyptus grandis]|uniref:indole-3-acetaldehyde oxidase n=2 Tax=Eucalyptus grandis TaxID=71139 RepID=A0A059ABH8_EUCGR|nr:abscisic-aldehyde oxidase [Eucalyptus grandis]KAK3408354.1 hypothetical protein EUGRSUZ_J00610 [Eucalyptus grandis]
MEGREAAAAASGGALVFAVNGERFEVSGVEPSTTLLEFLRTRTRFRSVKLGCGEGGCGACVVLLSRYDPVLDQVEDITASSCLTLLCSVNRCSVTTTEGLGNSRDGFHPIHQRFSGFHASQCGFCTPGMCISLYGAIVNAEKTDRPEPPPGFSKLSVFESEKAIVGNLCRCTGYRPIADACKSFAADVDLEDLGLNSFWRKGDSKEFKMSRLPPYRCKDENCTFPEFLKKEIKSSMLLDTKSYDWHTPTTVEDLQCLLETDGNSDASLIKLVSGNTGMGYYKEVKRWEKYIDLRNIPELAIVKADETGIEFGTTVTISKAIEALREHSKCMSSTEGGMIFRKTADHLEKIASGFIRNTASLGGNLVMAQRFHFPSDIATVLLAVDSQVTVMLGPKQERLTMEEFLERSPLDSRSVLLSIKIPTWHLRRSTASEATKRLLFETYRAAPRPLGNALPYLNAAFLAEVTVSEALHEIVINNCRLTFGAYGTQHAIRARKVEEALTGKVLSLSVLREAIEVVKATIVADYGTRDPAYRSSLAVGFVFKFLSPLIESRAKTVNNSLNGYNSAILAGEPNLTQDCSQISSLLSSSSQVFELNKEHYPVGEPIKKSEAAIQASGEAVYVDDIPSPANCLYGAFIYSTKPLARVEGIRIPSSVPSNFISSIISFQDIPDGGQNVGSSTIFGLEPLFADELAHCAGQPIALVVADTQKHADMAADSAVVDYDVDNLETPILSLEEAVERSSFLEVPSFLYPDEVGDLSKGMAEADNKILSAKIELGSQYYFYMENQTALAVPDEDNCMVVYSSIQCPEYAHNTIATCLGILGHNVRVITRRVGGGFGGKAIKAMPVATACALAAYKLRRPVRTYLNRKTDMIMAGGRHPMKVTYSVGFKSNGKITALRLDILINGGTTADISPVMPMNIVGALKKYDWGALSFDIKVCKTNHTSKSAMRAPGDVQGTFIAEAVIEHVASALSMNVDSVRDINLHTHSSLSLFYKHAAGEPQEYTVPSIWTKLALSSNMDQRIEMAKEFNRCSLWKKRGISRVPILFEVSLRATPGKVSILNDGSIVVEVGGIEIGQGLWTKVKQMVAFALSSVQCDGTTELLEKIRVIQADTLSLIQGGFTAGSTTSEASCQAARVCCDILVQRLSPLKNSLQEQMGSVTWEVLVGQAYQQSINLSASTYYAPELGSMQYLNYGAAVSEVEVDLLTGETRILRVDIIYDCGKSLNPAIDLGQIEGAFVQGLGFFMLEEYLTNSEGLVVAEGTWTYKIPTLDTIPKEFNVEILNSGHHQKRVLSSKASGEPPLLLAVSIHCAARAAIKEARKQLHSWSGHDECNSIFQLGVPATMPVVKGLCGLNSVESYLDWRLGKEQKA